ncbi:MAG: hypothetical protein ACLU4N_09095 [Butyricimonas faecihominis]
MGIYKILEQALSLIRATGDIVANFILSVNSLVISPLDGVFEYVICFHLLKWRR